jgi:hypothetical protein
VRFVIALKSGDAMRFQLLKAIQGVWMPVISLLELFDPKFTITSLKNS